MILLGRVNRHRRIHFLGQKSELKKKRIFLYSYDFTVRKFSFRPRPNADLGMHSRDAYPQFADMWVPPGYHIELPRISEYVFPITPGYLASPG